MNKALFHSSNCANVSIQDLPESLVYCKSMEGFTHGVWVALLAATPYYALNRQWATKKPWLRWGCKAVPLSIGLVLVAIAIEKDPHTGRWKFILTGEHASAGEENAETMDSAKRAPSLTSAVSNNNPTQIAPEIKNSVPQADKEETESEQKATGQHVATMSNREDLVLDQNDPRLLVAERVLARLLMTIEAEDGGRLRLKTFLCNLPTTPPQAPNKDIFQGVGILVKEANKDAVMAREGRQSKRWFQGQKHPFRIYVTNNSDKFYGYAKSDNSVIRDSGITEGLAMDEDLIAAVVAHELVHLVQRQHQERLSNAALVHLLQGMSLFIPKSPNPAELNTQLTFFCLLYCLLGIHSC
ncbi:hypothetical protein EMPS_10895 [Entomortierella parvispora]|uniref:Peptidase M48 domain-containing protein n=1 Tax=Entomortierella parvispora TaxID=205924 RepID=A0A9P3M1F7_9FUNG|nr:hypothetical protein EMPS_10895 [Entomortierella parvispora]